jgi:hypothetical protein
MLDFNDTFKFVVGKLTHILKGQSVDESLPPPIDYTMQLYKRGL